MKNPNIVQAFESQIIELETLFVRDDFGYDKKKSQYGSSGHTAAVVSMHIFFRIKPELSFHAYEYQNKGPIHTGMCDITMRSYAWGKDKIKNYVNYRNDDEIDLMTSIDESVANGMEALGDELKNYLRETDPDMVFPGDKRKEEHASHHKKEIWYPDVLDPFVSIFKGFGDIAKGFVGGAPKKAAGGHGGGHSGGHGGGHEKPDAKKDMKNYNEHHHVAHFATEAAYEGLLRYRMGPGGNIYVIDPG